MDFESFAGQTGNELLSSETKDNKGIIADKEIASDRALNKTKKERMKKIKRKITIF